MTQSLTNSSMTVGDVVVMPAAQASGDEQALVTYSPDQVGQGLTFFTQFDREDRDVLADVARGEVQNFLKDPTSIINYGSDVVDEVVAKTREVFAFTRDVKLPDDEDAALRNLKVQLDKVGGYDMSIAANLEKYRQMKAKLKARFGAGKAKAWFSAFMADRLTLEQLTGQMGGDFIVKAKHRALGANKAGQLFRANRDSLGNLKERVAVLEMARQLVEQQRAGLPAVVAPTDPLADQVAAIEMVSRMLDLKVTNLANRWYTGVALDPMLRAQQEQGIMMAMRLRDIGTLGMEKIELILAQYAMSLELQNDADAVAAFDALDNKLTQQVFKGTHATIVQAASLTSQSGTTVETISTIANEVTGMLTDVHKVYAASRANNAAQIQAITAGIKVMESAQDKPIDSALVGSVVEQARHTKSLLGS